MAADYERNRLENYKYWFKNFLTTISGFIAAPISRITHMMYHNNKRNMWISSFKAVWGWDDSYIYVANLSKRMDVIDPKQRQTVMELHDPLMRAIPCRIHCHPLNVGMLAGATAGGTSLCLDTKVAYFTISQSA